LAANVASVAGREDYLPVRLEMSPEGLLAQPVYGRSNLIFTLVRADGLVQIPAAATGLEKGERVEVRLF
jgi:molybdopterin molybdotransferase